MRVSALLSVLIAGLLFASIAFGQSSSESADAAAASSSEPAESEKPAPGQQMPYWFDKAAAAYERQDVEAWVEATEELHRLRPYNQDFMRHLVEGHARLGNLSQSYDIMLKMQQQGLSEDWDAIPAVEPLRDHELYDHLNGLMAEAGEPFGDVSTWSTLGEAYPMPEAMAYDAEGDRLFVGTVRDGLILTSVGGDEWETWASPDDVPQLQSVFDLVVDAERGHLWVATGRIPYTRAEEREDDVRSSLLRLDLDSGELQREYKVSARGGRNLLGSLELADDGTVFAADTRAPVIYRLNPGADELQPYFGHPEFTSLRGIALNDDGSLLYVADYELGLFVIDASGGKQAWKLAVPETFNAGGIDGLFWWDGHLVAIQNVITPQRVVRLELGEDGLGVNAVAPLAAALEVFDSPTYGAMDDEDLYFFAASHWHHVDSEGNPKSSLPEVPIMKLDVDNASVRTVGQDALEQLRRQQQESQQDSQG